MSEREIPTNAPDEQTGELPVAGLPPRGISRRGFLKTMAAVGVGAALASQAPRFASARDQLNAELTPEQLVDMQKMMLRIRWFDRTVGDRQLSGGYRSYMHASCGHEGIAAGVNMALRRDDYVTGYHRSHHHTIGKGADLNRTAAEIEYKATGVNKGYGGSMHLMQKDVGMIGEDGIVGPGGIMAAGVAAAIKARGGDQVSVAYGGDAHFTTPYFALALHRAMQYQLPFIYVIEKNGYQTSKPVKGPGYLTNGLSGQSYLDSHTEISRGFRMPSFTVDGMSAVEVYTVMKAAVDRARAGLGPSFVEAECYRYYDHFGVGGAKPGELGAFGRAYRSDREVRHWLAKDPIVLHRRYMIDLGIQTEAEADELEEEMKAEVAAAFKFADDSPVPDARDGLKLVYVKGTVLPRQLPECPLYIEGYIEGTPEPAGYPMWEIGDLPPSRVSLEEYA
jgi:acetoin:2,6-dichlorophenolindophenol oxidoreductase subunit alpha